MSILAHAREAEKEACERMPDVIGKGTEMTPNVTSYLLQYGEVANK
jgi:hypothetical protein